VNRELSAVIARADVAIRGRMAARRALREAEPGSAVATAPGAYRHLIHLLASDCKSVLDVGTGLMHSLEAMPCSIKVGLEVHRPYLESCKLDDAVAVNASAFEIERLFVPDAFDLVTLIDVLEHFAQTEALEVLRQVEVVARRRIVLFTPRGEFPQEGHDAFGLGGEEFQRHRSAWEPEDLLGLGYRVAVLEGFHDQRNKSFMKAFGPDAPAVDALLAWKGA
jgi:hypothetical protein